MSALHAAVTAATPSDVDVKAPHDRLDRRQIFLILRGDVRLAYRIATGRTGLGHRHGIRLMHDGWDGPLPAATIRLARLAPRAARPPLRRAFRERRRLSGTRAAGGIQFVFQSRVLALQPYALALDAGPFGLRSFERLPQSRVLSPKLRDRPGGFLIVSAPAHAPVMPECVSV
jgi:hypothetical protein